MRSAFFLMVFSPAESMKSASMGIVASPKSALSCMKRDSGPSSSKASVKGPNAASSSVFDGGFIYRAPHSSSSGARAMVKSPMRNSNVAILRSGLGQAGIRAGFAGSPDVRSAGEMIDWLPSAWLTGSHGVVRRLKLIMSPPGSG